MSAPLQAKQPPADLVMMHACDTGAALWPPSPSSPCCWGAAVYEDRCTCWEPVRDIPVTYRVEEGPSHVRARRCHDCAYRPDSPERSAGTPLPQTVEHGVFLCHDGMPKALEYVHPDGSRACAWPRRDDYIPVTVGRGQSWQADGRPALTCAGWASVAGVKPTRGGAS